MPDDFILAVYVPADTFQPIALLSLPSELTECGEQLQRLVGGFIQAVRWLPGQPERDTVYAYINENGKIEDLPRNARATRLLAASLPAGDYIAGDAVFLGVDENGDSVSCPELFVAAAMQWDAGLAWARP